MTADRKDEIRLWVQIGLTAVLLLFSLGVIAFCKDDTLLKWAIGIIGVIIGYWLK